MTNKMIFFPYVSQVCNLVWSKNVNELVSTHGYSQNQIIVWKYPTMSKVHTRYAVNEIDVQFFRINFNMFYH